MNIFEYFWKRTFLWKFRYCSFSQIMVRYSFSWLYVFWHLNVRKTVLQIVSFEGISVQQPRESFYWATRCFVLKLLHKIFHLKMRMKSYGNFHLKMLFSICESRIGRNFIICWESLIGECLAGGFRRRGKMPVLFRPCIIASNLWRNYMQMRTVAARDGPLWLLTFFYFYYFCSGERAIKNQFIISRI